MVRTERARGWCFTVNNPNSFDEQDLEKLKEAANYVIYGDELGESGTPHWQGYCHFNTVKSLLQVKELLPRAHWERQRGSIRQAIEYCEKDGSTHEFGERPRGGELQRDKWKDIVKLAEAGKINDIKSSYPDVYFRYTSKLFSLYKPERPIILDTLENEWWVGPTGTGKSRTLWSMYPNHFSKTLNKWWDGYANEETVAIEEWSPKNECTASQLKIWADRYPFSAEVKGGTLQRIRPKRIIVLSNYTIEECFPQAQDQEPIQRRFRVKHFINF